MKRNSQPPPSTPPPYSSPPKPQKCVVVTPHRGGSPHPTGNGTSSNNSNPLIWLIIVSKYAMAQLGSYVGKYVMRLLAKKLKNNNNNFLTTKPCIYINKDGNSSTKITLFDR